MVSSPQPLSSYRDRVVDDEIPAVLGAARAVLIEGPKACGKTWTGRRFARSALFLEERPDLWEIATQVRGLLLEGATPRLLDEWQRVPELWHLVRAECDRRGLPGQFILTGSAVPPDDLTRHSGAGRIGRVRMRPMSLYEMRLSGGEASVGQMLKRLRAWEPPEVDVGVEVPDLVQAACRGGWPQFVDLAVDNAMRQVRSYVDDICRVDVSAVDGIRRSPERVMRLMQSLARNVAAHVSVDKLAKETEGTTPLNRNTAAIYLETLSRLFVVEDLPAWNIHIRSRERLLNAPKRHFVDPSLAPAALGVGPERYLDDLEAFGFLFESMAVRDLRIYAQAHDALVHYYRDYSGLEVDAVIERRDGRWIGAEVKLGGAGAIDRAAAALLKLAERVTERRAAQLAQLVVITGGRYSYRRSDGVAVVPPGGPRAVTGDRRSDHHTGSTSSSSRRVRTRCSRSSRMVRTSSRVLPDGSSTCQSM